MSTSYSCAQWLPVKDLTPDLISFEYLITTVKHISKEKIEMLMSKNCTLSEETLIVNSTNIDDATMRKLLHRLHTYRNTPLCFCVTKMALARGMVSTVFEHPEWFSLSDKNENILHIIAKNGGNSWSDILIEMVNEEDSLGRPPLFYVLMRNLPQQAALRSKLIQHTTTPNKDLLRLMVKHDISQFINAVNVNQIDPKEMTSFQAFECCKVYLKLAKIDKLEDIIFNRIAVIAFTNGDEAYGLSVMRKTYQDYVPQSIKDFIYKKVSFETRMKINAISSPNRMNDDYSSGDDMRKMTPPDRKLLSKYQDLDAIRTRSSDSADSDSSRKKLSDFVGRKTRPTSSEPAISSQPSIGYRSRLDTISAKRMAARKALVDGASNFNAPSALSEQRSDRGIPVARSSSVSSSGSDWGIALGTDGKTRLSRSERSSGQSYRGIPIARSSSNSSNSGSDWGIALGTDGKTRLPKFPRLQSANSTSSTSSYRGIRIANTSSNSKPMAFQKSISGRSARVNELVDKFRSQNPSAAMPAASAAAASAPAAQSRRTINQSRIAPRSNYDDPYKNQTNTVMRPRSVSSSASSSMSN